MNYQLHLLIWFLRHSLDNYSQINLGKTRIHRCREEVPQNNTSTYKLLSVSRSLLHFVLNKRLFQCIPASKTVIFQSKPLEFWQSTFPASTFLILTKQVWDIILRDQIRRVEGKKNNRRLQSRSQTAREVAQSYQSSGSKLTNAVMFQKQKQ